MINAVLVFNNSGQPRLTKFYTQLVPLATPLSLPPLPWTPLCPNLLMPVSAGHFRPTTSHLRNLHPRLPPPVLRLQLPPSPSPSRPLPQPTPNKPTTQRHPLPNNLPPLRHPLLHPHQHLHRIPLGPTGLDTGFCGGTGSAV